LLLTKLRWRRLIIS